MLKHVAILQKEEVVNLLGVCDTKFRAD